ncbi:MAG: glycosyltransferase family 39 protein [Chloroflexi bacterium]|nr:glycosyltransferase family 39 protein [Chloroflexota bacterium]
MATLRALQLRVENSYAWATRSWMPAMVVILVTFALVTRLLDDYPILPDGLRSIATAGGLEAESNLTSVFEKLTDVSQQHMPGYFLALFVWGKIAGWDPLLLRTFSVFFGILILALIFRLGRDFVSREAGIFSIVMLASLSFYNLWYLPVRMYTLFVATGLWLLWLYLRAVVHNRTSPRDYALLFLACALFLYSQIFSLAVGLGLALHHLFFNMLPAARAERNRYLTQGRRSSSVPPSGLVAANSRHCLLVAAAGALAGLTILPWLSTLLTGTAEIVGGEFGDIRVLSPVETATTILSLSMNASILFLGLLALSVRQVLKRDRTSITLWTILIVAIVFYAAVNWATGAIDLHRSRYFVVLFPLIILLLNVGLAQLNRWKLVSLGILLFWIASGLLYQRRVGADIFVRSYNTIPIHLVERHLRADLRPGDLLAGWSGGLSFEYRTPYGGIIDYYFSDEEIDIEIQHTYALQQLDDEEISATLAERFAGYKRIWLTYELDNTARFHKLYQDALALAHARCFRDRTLARVAIELYGRPGCD